MESEMKTGNVMSLVEGEGRSDVSARVGDMICSG